MRILKQTCKFLAFWFILFIGMMGCEETDSTIGFSGAESKIETIMVDTFTVRTSTVLLDSMYSSGTNRALVGEYTDLILGKTSASSYFQIAPAISTWSIQSDAVFDSVALLLSPDGYYYGDTTREINISVERLKQDIIARSIDKNIFKDVPASYYYRNAMMYNTSKTSSFEDELGRLSFTPSTLTKDSISVRLSDDLGKHWFQLAKDNDQQITTTENFLTEFKGLKLSVEDGASALVGFNVSKIKARVYYHITTNTEYLQNVTFDIPIYQTNLQYNHIQTEYGATSLSTIERGKALASELTGNETFVQGGSGLMTKLEFPYLNLLTEQTEHITILQSILTVTAVQEYPQENSLPTQLGLYYGNTLNIPTNVIASETNASNPNVASLNSDIEFNKYSNYTFSINTYISSLIRGEKIYPKQIFLGLNTTNMPNTVTRIRLGNQVNPNYKIKLQVYYSRYQTSQ